MTVTKNAAAKAAADSTPVENPVNHEKVIAQLQEDLEHTLVQNKSLLKDLESANETNAELLSQLEEAAELIEDLKAQLGAGSTDKAPVVIVDGLTYTVTKGYRDRNNVYTPQDIAADKAKCADLVKRGSTILKLKTD
jgi:hypothetical protein